MLDSKYRQGLTMAHGVSKADVLSDRDDGKVFTSNVLFQENQKSLKLVLYQDAFEVVNPLGSAKKKHKIFAVYFSLLHMPPHVRSNTDHMQSVLLCREKDFKEFGHSRVFSELLTDLKILEENGITMADESVAKGAPYRIAGDNPGSRRIGGFTENVSTSQYFCRYCLITRSEFQSENPAIIGPERTPETYRSATKQLEREDVTEVQGIKFRYDGYTKGHPRCHSSSASWSFTGSFGRFRGRFGETRHRNRGRFPVYHRRRLTACAEAHSGQKTGRCTGPK
ncbi:uncharacterized protein LOC114136593 [Xiphophorus couchianus]|uniref:uncharacterized protein LOC114136593 n=1 Tax=Xiphophorus couchianus TaxID=32473 RepID=UPI0010161A95|nr:uncharacterized protein LOC114136593 [Xiphophorus couchianus]